MFCDHCGQPIRHVVLESLSGHPVERWVCADWTPSTQALPPLCPRRDVGFCTPEVGQ